MSLLSLRAIMAFILSPTVFVTIGLLLLAIIYNFAFKNWWYFSARRVPFCRGWPFLGSIYKMIIGEESFAVTVRRLYNQFPAERFFGAFELTQPVFIIRDPELVREITVQNFDHFTNHQGDIHDPILGRGLFFLKDQKWKDMRATLSPAFTGNKIRFMFGLIQDSTLEFMQHLAKQDKASTGKGVVYELKDLFTRYTSNIIAICAFGLKVNSVVNRDNHFYKAGKSITNFDGIQGIKLLLYDCIPTLMKLFRVQLFDRLNVEYFKHVIRSTIINREKNEIIQSDLINLLMQAREAKQLSDGKSSAAIGGKASSLGNDDKHSSSKTTSTIEWNDDDMVAQCLIFFFAGFETVSTLLCFMAHELALNKDIQTRLLEEILAIESELDGKPLSYDDTQKMKYMEMVIMETLRRWPPIPSTDRQVTKPIVLDNLTGTKVPLTTADSVWIPIFGLHMDSKYFPNPELFDPERFSEENKANITPGSYLPFGNGQRACIASRFAIMEAKIIFYNLLKTYVIDICEKTSNPVVLKKNTINMVAEGGFWVKLIPRQN